MDMNKSNSTPRNCNLEKLLMRAERYIENGVRVGVIRRNGIWTLRIYGV